LSEEAKAERTQLLAAQNNKQLEQWVLRGVTHVFGGAERPRTLAEFQKLGKRRTENRRRRRALKEAEERRQLQDENLPEEKRRVLEARQTRRVLLEERIQRAQHRRSLRKMSPARRRMQQIRARRYAAGRQSSRMGSTRRRSLSTKSGAKRKLTAKNSLILMQKNKVKAARSMRSSRRKSP